MRVYLKNYRQSPRKVRLVADLIRGKSVPVALHLLSVTPKRATVQLEKTIKSALANAKQKGMGDATTLRIQEIRVDKGLTQHRFLPRAQGRATKIDKHSSNITLVLSEIKQEAPSTKLQTPNKSETKAATVKKATKTKTKLTANL
jgi:large subunit ribosomal protein L22